MAIELTDEQWEPIDEWILRGWIINGIRAIREATGAAIPEAIDIYLDRYNRLRASRPEEFICEHKEYWSGLYS
jgi:hypothetical protein